MKNYLIFSAFFIPHLGGVERYTYNLARALIRKGHGVTVVTSLLPDSSDYEIIDGIEVYRLPCFNLLNGRFPIPKLGIQFKKLIEKLNQKKYDFGVVQTRFYLHSLYGAFYLKKHGVPGIVVEHGTDHFTVNNSLFDWIGHIYEHVATAILKVMCHEFYGVSQSCTKWSGHFGIKSKGVLYNAVDLQDIQEKLENPIADYREELNLSDRFIVCYAGRLVREKGILKLIDAVNKLNAANEKVTLLVAGDGELYDELCAKKYDHVIMLGKIDFAHVIALYKASDVFALPTDYPEGFPTSVLEAAACCCYVITTRNGGSKELLLNEDYGVVLQMNTVENIADAILRALKDEKYRKQSTQNTYERLCDMFTWEKVSEKLVSIQKAQGDMNHD